jgi:hypothetical protein
MITLSPSLNMWVVTYAGNTAYFKYKHVAEQVLRFWMGQIDD